MDIGSLILEGLSVTAIGMGVTFLILVILVLFLKIMPHVLALIKRIFNRSNDEQPSQESKTEAVKPAVVTPTVIDDSPTEEEVACIIAAVCALSGLEERQFTVTRIKRNKASSWRTNF